MLRKKILSSKLDTRLLLVRQKDNNNQAFYSQTSWGRLEIKPHKPKKQGQNKSEKEEA
jgi:hypothetical protein